MRAPLVVLALLASASVTACTGSGKPTSPPSPAPTTQAPLLAGKGAIEGLLTVAGSATGGSFVPLPGVVTASDNKRTWSAQVGADGHFRLDLPPGTYTLRGTSPRYNHGARDACHATGSVPVTAGQVISASVICIAETAVSPSP